MYVLSFWHVHFWSLFRVLFFLWISLVSQFLGPNRFDCVCIVTSVACFVVRFEAFQSINHSTPGSYGTENQTVRAYFETARKSRCRTEEWVHEVIVGGSKLDRGCSGLSRGQSPLLYLPLGYGETENMFFTQNMQFQVFVRTIAATTKPQANGTESLLSGGPLAGHSSDT